MKREENRLLKAVAKEFPAAVRASPLTRHPSTRR
jgi:hypothetical protein